MLAADFLGDARAFQNATIDVCGDPPGLERRPCAVDRTPLVLGERARNVRGRQFETPVDITRLDRAVEHEIQLSDRLNGFAEDIARLTVRLQRGQLGAVGDVQLVEHALDPLLGCLHHAQYMLRLDLAHRDRRQDALLAGQLLRQPTDLAEQRLHLVEDVARLRVVNDPRGYFKLRPAHRFPDELHLMGDLADGLVDVRGLDRVGLSGNRAHGTQRRC